MKGFSAGTIEAHERAFRVATIAAWVALAACGPDRGAEPEDPAVNAPIVVGSDTLGPQQVRSYLARALGFTSRGGRVFCSYGVLGQEGHRVFLKAACEELVPGTDSLESGSGSGGPVAVVLDTLARPPRIVGHKVPGDGDRFGRDIRAIFPDPVQRQILAGPTPESRRLSHALQRANRESARADYACQNGEAEATFGEPCR